MTKTPHFPRILITGANGRLGRLLQGASLARRPSPTQLFFAARSGDSDLPPFDAFALPGNLPAAGMVVALWGVTSGTPEALERNSDLVAATRALARATGARKALHLSSAGVYGPGEALTEQGPARPGSDYGRAKLRMEEAVAALTEDGIAHCCLRLANVVGADSLAPALQGNGPVSLTRFGDGRGPLRSYVAPGHLLDIFIALANVAPSALPPVLNVAASDPVEMQTLAEAAGKRVAWKPVTPADHQRVTLCTGPACGLAAGAGLA